MKKWIRWQGIVVFGVFFLLLFLGWILFADMLVKRFIEAAGTRIVGARVELADVDVRLLPLGITLVNLQVTNPDSPMSNAFEAGQIEFSPDMLNLLRRKIVIDAMAMEGVRFNTPRKTSGATASQARGTEPAVTPSGTSSAGRSLPSLQIPDINAILAREKLVSLDRINDLRAEIDSVTAAWQQRLDDAPDQKTFEQYQERARKLKKDAKGVAGVLAVANDVKKLQKDVSADLERIKGLQKDFNRDKAALQKKLEQLKSAPREDVDRLMRTYNFSADGLGNVSQLLFGDKIGGSIAKAIFWYGKLKPFLEKAGPGEKTVAEAEPERGRGVNVRFEEADPLPDLLIRQVRVSMTIPAGNMGGEIRQISSDQARLGLPLEFKFSGEALESIQSVSIEGSLDHVRPGNATDRVTAAVKRYQVEDLTLSDSTDLPVVLKNGVAHFNLSASLKADVLDADIKVTMEAVRLAVAAKTDGNQLQEALGAALADVSGFFINARVAGPLDHYQVKMTSDLDRVLAKAVGKQVKNLSAEFQGNLRAAVMDRVAGPMAEIPGGMSGLEVVDRELASRLKAGNVVSGSLLM